MQFKAPKPSLFEKHVGETQWFEHKVIEFDWAFLQVFTNCQYLSTVTNYRHLVTYAKTMKGV